MPERANGTALFADISGFTPLTEALNAKFGARRGAEELGRRLDEVYSALISQVEARGGSVIGFAGDAIQCWFGGDEHPGDAARLAVDCAFAFQDTMGALASLGAESELGIKLSVASGPVRRLVAGDPALQLHDALAGATIARLALGEHYSQRGEVVVDEATRGFVPEGGVRFERFDAESSTRFFVLAPTAVRPALARRAEETVAELPVEVLRPWVPRSIHARILAGQQDFLGEFRPCVALFVHFEGIDWDSDVAGEQLDLFTRRLQTLAEQRGGELFQITIGDKGSYAYLAFGAVRAHEDDSRRAVATGLAVRDLGLSLDFLTAVRVGISQGTLFVGDRKSVV